MVAVKYLGVAFAVLVGCCAISEATVGLGGGGSTSVKVDISSTVNLCGGVLSHLGLNLQVVLGGLGKVLGSLFGIINNLLGGLLGGSYNGGSFFGYGNQVPTDVSVFIGGVPKSNGATLDLIIKIFASIHPFFDKGCGRNFGTLYTRALYAYVTIIASANADYATGSKCVKRVRYNGDISSLYEQLEIRSLISEWDSLVRAEGGDVTKISGPKGYCYQYANYLFLKLRNRNSYLDINVFIGGLLQSVFGLVGFAGHLVTKEVNSILGFLTNLLGGLGLGSGCSGYFPGWTSTIVSQCNSIKIDVDVFIGH